MPGFRESLDALDRIPNFIAKFLPELDALRIVVTNCVSEFAARGE